MSILTDAQLREARRLVAEQLEYSADVNFTRAEFHAALQALEDWYEGERATLNQILNAATSPTRMSVQIKAALVVVFIRAKMDREAAELL